MCLHASLQDCKSANKITVCHKRALRERCSKPFQCSSTFLSRVYWMLSITSYPAWHISVSPVLHTVSYEWNIIKSWINFIIYVVCIDLVLFFRKTLVCGIVVCSHGKLWPWDTNTLHCALKQITNRKLQDINAANHVILMTSNILFTYFWLKNDLCNLSVLSCLNLLLRHIL